MKPANRPRMSAPIMAEIYPPAGGGYQRRLQQ
jgi:hypothetical protein